MSAAPPITLPQISLPSADQYAAVALSHKIVYSGLSGCIATTCIYPIDFVKTTLMNTRTAATAGHALPYTGPISCASHIIRTHGITGLFRGYPPNVLFVAPEKALKLTLNDGLRNQFRSMSSTNTLTFGGEMAAGGLAGFIQVIATNPMELLKIKGATVSNAESSTIHGATTPFSYSALVRSLGVTGLYTGVVSTWMRDVPFSVIYFTMYGQAKARLIPTNTSTTSTTQSTQLMPFVSGAIAGTTAAALTTPLDVIKTRVHAAAVRAPAGTFWRNEFGLVRHTVSQLLQNEGVGALFKGIVPRCMIISPLFAITMTCYESMQRQFH